MIPSIREPITSLITSEATKKLSSELAEEVRQEAGMALLAHEREEQIANPLRWYRRTARFIKYSLNRGRSRQAKHFVPLVSSSARRLTQNLVHPVPFRGVLLCQIS